MAWKGAPIDLPEFVRKQLFNDAQTDGDQPSCSGWNNSYCIILTFHSVLRYAQVYLALFMADSKARLKIMRSTLSVVIRTVWAKMEQTIDIQFSEAPMDESFNENGCFSCPGTT